MCEQPGQRIEELRLTDRFGQIRRKQRVAVARLAPAERAEQHERQRRVFLANLARQRDAVHLRHVHVDDRDVEGVGMIEPT